MCKMRLCKVCGILKPLDAYPPYCVRGFRGLRHTCRQCWNAKWTPIVEAHNQRYYDNNHAGMRDAAKKRAHTWHVNNPDPTKREAQSLSYEKKYPERKLAKIAVQMAVRSGRLPKQLCVVCGATNAMAHHENYSQQLDVMWLCPEHHGERHRQLHRVIKPINGKVVTDPDKFPSDLQIREYPR